MKLLNKNTLLGCLIGLVCAALAVAYSPQSKHDRAGKSGDLSELKPGLSKFFKEDLTVFEKKREPGPSDWLAIYKEKGQTYGQYLADKPNFPDEKRNVLYVLPLGEFNDDAPALDELQVYMEAYYTPLKIKMLDPIEAEKVKATSRMNAGQLQWKTPDILKWMKAKIPKDAYGMLAVTMTDLYPDEKWNFVFGQASFKERVGVFSFARYGAEDKKVALIRAAKVLTHEMGHMFGIKHCTFYQCNMNGANHLTEMDNAPPNLCNVCLRKLHKATDFDPVDRYTKLGAFYQKHAMDKEAKWIEQRLGE